MPRHPPRQVDAHTVGSRCPAQAPGRSAAPPRQCLSVPGTRLGRDAPLLRPPGHTQGMCAVPVSPEWLFSPRQWGLCGLPAPQGHSRWHVQLTNSIRQLETPTQMHVCANTHTHTHAHTQNTPLPLLLACSPRGPRPETMKDWHTPLVSEHYS